MHTSARLPPLSQPELISLSPVGGPVAGRTSVTLRMSADLPLVDWALLRCKFGSKGETPISGIATAPAKEGAQLNRRRVAPSAAHPYDLEVGSPTGLTLVCLSPAVDEEADVEVSLTLNGQQYASSSSLFYSSLPSESICGRDAASSERLPGLRFRFFYPPRLHSISPNVGPFVGGTRLTVRGEGFFGNRLHGGDRSALCRIGLIPGAIVPATLRSDWMLECATPAARTGSATVIVSLNGGSEWFANSTYASPSVPHLQHPAVVFRHACDANAALPECLRDAGCGWCYDDAAQAEVQAEARAEAQAGDDAATSSLGKVGGRCMPCLAHGAGACAAGPSKPYECASWTFVRDLSLIANTGWESYRIAGTVEASRMAYLRVAPPHPHGTLRLLMESPDAVGVYRLRGGAPEATLENEVASVWPMRLAASIEEEKNEPARNFTCTLRGCHARESGDGGGGDGGGEGGDGGGGVDDGGEAIDSDGGSASDGSGATTHGTTRDPLSDPQAWYIGLQGRFFYERTINHPKRAMVGNLLDPPVYDGILTLRHAPHDGNFDVTANRTSDFAAAVAFDFNYTNFADAKCGEDPVACGLSVVGAAAAGGASGAGAGARRANATLLRGRSNDAGALWQLEPLPLSRGFVSSFRFRVTNRSFCGEALPPGVTTCNPSALIGGGGFGFVVHSAAAGADALGCAGSGDGIRRTDDPWRAHNDSEKHCSACVAPALAIRFDTYANLSWDPKLHQPRWRHHNRLQLHTVDCTAPTDDEASAAAAAAAASEAASAAAGAHDVDSAAAGAAAGFASDQAALETAALPLFSTALGPRIRLDDGASHTVQVRM